MKNMKPITKLFVFLIFLGLTASCSKEYLEVSPTNQISTSSAFNTTANGWAAINGIHRSLYIKYYGNQDQSGQGTNMIYMDTFGEDVVYNGLPNRLFFYTSYSWSASRTVTSNVPYFNYRFYYTIIANANMIIDHIDQATGPQSEKDIIKAQALTYRAFSYFQMVQLFGERYDAQSDNSTLGMSLILSSTDAEAVPRSTVAQTYQQINSDLDDAIELFQVNWSRPNKSHLNIHVAQGIKARVALTQQNWSLAAEMAKAARSGYPIMSEAQYFEGFNNWDNPEWMWSFRMTAEQEIDFYSFFAYFSADFNASNVRANPKAIFSPLYDKISSTDYRAKLFDPTGTNTEFPIPPNGIRAKYMQRKFRIKPGQTLSIGDVPLMRSSEMYLIEAEAKAHLNDETAADVLFELISKRDHAYVRSNLRGQALLDEIHIHRRIELWGEGFRFLDLKRLNQPMDRTGGNHNIAWAVVMNVPAGDKRWVFLIPNTEIEAANGVVEQNPL